MPSKHPSDKTSHQGPAGPLLIISNHFGCRGFTVLGLGRSSQKIICPTISSFLSAFLAMCLPGTSHPSFFNLLTAHYALSGCPVPQISPTTVCQTHRHQVLPWLFFQRSLPTGTTHLPLSQAQSTEIHPCPKEGNHPTQEALQEHRHLIPENQS